MSMGVSIIICCHNSAKELPQTLTHLAAQAVDSDVDWEVIVIDNASSDDTAKAATSLWPQDAITPMRVVSEPKLGIINARYRGIAEARYEILSFIDDDNWVCPTWVQTVSDVMSEHPEVGACGSKNIPEFEGEKPWWFDLSGKSYAVGSQGPESGGDVTWTEACLVGAGLSLRKTAAQQLIEAGFQSLLVGCKGKALNRGEDTEICFALVLAGWHLWYEPRLQLKHFLTADRLHWKYLRRLRRGGGRATLGFDPYRLVFEECEHKHDISFWWHTKSSETRQPDRRIWQQQLFSAFKDLLRHPLTLVSSLIQPMEGDIRALKTETRIGRFLELLQSRETYDINIQTVKSAAWRKDH
ncbi:MAG: glycosyltransferase [Cyanobacteria bacterium J06560_6]